MAFHFTLVLPFGDTQRPARDFLADLMEFHSLAGTYNDICVTAIFEYVPQEQRAELPAETKRTLNSFQQRFERFVGEYQEFSKRLSQSRPVLQGLPTWLNAPKPLN